MINDMLLLAFFFLFFIFIEFMLYFSLQLNIFTICIQIGALQSSLLYSPPDLNKNITEIFGRLIDIYRGEILFCIIGCLLLLCSLGDLMSCGYCLWKHWVMTEGHLATTRLFQLLRSCPSKLKVQTKSKTYPRLESHCKIM